MGEGATRGVLGDVGGSLTGCGPVAMSLSGSWRGMEMGGPESPLGCSWLCRASVGWGESGGAQGVSAGPPEPPGTPRTHPAAAPAPPEPPPRGDPGRPRWGRGLCRGWRQKQGRGLCRRGGAPGSSSGGEGSGGSPAPFWGAGPAACWGRDQRVSHAPKETTPLSKGSLPVRSHAPTKTTPPIRCTR